MDDSLSEFLENISKITADYKEYVKMRDAFAKDLAQALSKYTLKKYPFINNNTERVQFLEKEANDNALMAFEYVIDAIEKEDFGEEVKSDWKIPRQQTDKEYEEELEEFLTLMPTEKHDIARKIYGKDREDLIQAKQEEIDLHNVIKTVIVQHFEADIIGIDADNIRYLDYISWLMCGFGFLDIMYQCAEASGYN